MIEKMPEEYKGNAMKKFDSAKTTPRKWTKEEIEWCLKMREKGYNTFEIAESVDRSEVSVNLKLKRLTKKSNTYNAKHVLEKYEVNKEFINHIEPATILDVYCGENSFYKSNYDDISVVTNDKDKKIEADYNLDALKFLCLMYCEGKSFDIVDLDPFGSASECLDLAIKMANKGLIVTLGEMGHKRWKRLDFVSRHYDIHSLEDFTSQKIIDKIVEQGAKNKKLLVPHIYKDWKFISRVWFEIKPMKIDILEHIEGEDE